MLSFSLLMLAICLSIQFIPSVDNESGLYTWSCILTSTFMYALMGNPLIMDYIKTYSRGRATALQQMGQLVGELIGFMIIFRLYKTE